jgi:hypothetical protein
MDWIDLVQNNEPSVFHTMRRISSLAENRLASQEGLCSVEQKGKGLPQQAEETQGFPVRLGPRIFLTFGTTRVVDRQP